MNAKAERIRAEHAEGRADHKRRLQEDRFLEEQVGSALEHSEGTR